jgi:hypothetical protein
MSEVTIISMQVKCTCNSVLISVVIMYEFDSKFGAFADRALTTTTETMQVLKILLKLFR